MPLFWIDFEYLSYGIQLKKIKSDIWHGASLACSPIYPKELENRLKINQLLILAYCFHYYNGRCIFTIAMAISGPLHVLWLLVTPHWPQIGKYVFYIPYISNIKWTFFQNYHSEKKNIIFKSFQNQLCDYYIILFWTKKIMFKKETLA